MYLARSVWVVFLHPPGQPEAQVELTWNWDPEKLEGGRNFGHLAYAVEDIYALCQRLMDAGVTIHRPPRDGHMLAGWHIDRIAAGRGGAAFPGAVGLHAKRRRVVGLRGFVTRVRM